METDAEFMERQGRLLKGFSEQAARLAEDLSACALAAETYEEKQSLSFAFHRMGRALRQTLALEARLRRDQLRAERDARAEAQAAEKARRAARKARIEATMERLVWQEAEDPDWAHGRLEDMERFLAEDDAHDRIPDDLGAYIAHLCRELDMTPPEEFGPPDPPREGEASRSDGGGCSPQTSALAAPHPLRGSSPSGGASEDDDEQDYWASG